MSLWGTNGGFDNEQEWYVLHLDEDTNVVYYFGSLMSWHFEGVLVMAKNGALNPEKLPAVEAAIAKIGLTLDDLCTLSPQDNCPAEDMSF